MPSGLFDLFTLRDEGSLENIGGGDFKVQQSKGGLESRGAKEATGLTMCQVWTHP